MASACKAHTLAVIQVLFAPFQGQMNLKRSIMISIPLHSFFYSRLQVMFDHYCIAVINCNDKSTDIQRNPLTVCSCVFFNLLYTHFSIHCAEQTDSSYILQTRFRWLPSYRIALSARTVVELYCWHFSHWKWPFFALIKQLRLSAFSMERNFHDICGSSFFRKN